MDPVRGTEAGRLNPVAGSGLDAAFPKALSADVAAALTVMPTARHSPAGSFDASVGVEHVRIPYRIYSDEPTTETYRRLTPVQQTVLHCLYTRHHDGYVRQRHVERILPLAEEWIAPFVVHLVGEYVLEIVLRISDGLAGSAAPGSTMNTVYGRFAAANPDFIAHTSQRGASYWNCYHRDRYPQLAEYPATPLLASIRNATRPAPRPPGDEHVEPAGPYG